MYALGQIAENSDLQTKLISEAIEELKEEKKKKCKNDEQKQEIEVTQSTAKPQIITPVPVEQRQEECRVILLENGQEQCEQCGTIQRSGRLVCWHCGAKFIRNNEWNKT